MSLVDLFGKTVSTNDKIVDEQRRMAQDAARRAEDLKLRRQGAVDQIEAIFGGGTYNPAAYRPYDWAAIDKMNEGAARAANPPKSASWQSVWDPARGEYTSQRVETPSRPRIEDRLDQIFARSGLRPRVPSTGPRQTYSGIGDDFYDAYRTSIMDYYEPQLTENYRDAQGQTMLKMARQGIRQSSAAGEAAGDLRKDYDLQYGNLAMNADAQTSGLRQRVMAEKQGLLDLARSAEDPSSAVDRALSEVNAVQTQQPTLTPLGDLFQAAAIGYGSYQGEKDRQRYLSTVPTSNTFKGSGRVVG